MKLDEGMMLVELLRIPVLRNQPHQPRLCGVRVSAWGERKPLRDPQVIRVHAKRTTPQWRS